MLGSQRSVWYNMTRYSPCNALVLLLLVLILVFLGVKGQVWSPRSSIWLNLLAKKRIVNQPQRIRTENDRNICVCAQQSNSMPQNQRAIIRAFNPLIIILRTITPGLAHCLLWLKLTSIVDNEWTQFIVYIHSWNFQNILDNLTKEFTISDVYKKNRQW